MRRNLNLGMIKCIYREVTQVCILSKSFDSCFESESWGQYQVYIYIDVRTPKCQDDHYGTNMIITWAKTRLFCLPLIWIVNIKAHHLWFAGNEFRSIFYANLHSILLLVDNIGLKCNLDHTFFRTECQFQLSLYFDLYIQSVSQHRMYIALAINVGSYSVYLRQ